MPAPIKKIRHFLELCVELEEKGSARGIELVLYSVNLAGRKSPVWRSMGIWTVDNIAPIIAESSQESANTFGRTARFILLAFDGNDKDRSTSVLNMSWALSPDVKEEPEEDPEEKAYEERKARLDDMFNRVTKVLPSVVNRLADKELLRETERASDSDLIAQLTRHNIELLQLLAKR